MTRSRSTFVLAVLVSLAGAGGAGAWLFLARDTAPIETFAPRAQEAVPQPGPRIADAPAIVAPPQAMTEHEGGLTTVIHPLVVELAQLQRGTFEDTPEVPPPGSGANARLRGRVTTDRGVGEQAEVAFTAGPNAGRVLRTDSEGRFGASDLYQGLAIVLVESQRGVKSEREVMLRSLSESELNVPLGADAAAMVRGTVTDTMGEPLSAAEVRLDGSIAFTDDQGEFYFPRVSPGTVLAVVKKHGYAHKRETVPIPRSRVVERDRLTFALYEGASLELTLEALVGSSGPATAYIFPVGGQQVNTELGQRTFPWHEINPVEVHAGGRTLVEGLQPGHVSIMVFHPGAIASPPMETKKLYPGRPNQHVLRLKTAPVVRGVVTDPDGQPVSGARVTFEAPHRSFATTKVMQKKPTFNLELVLPELPSAVQRTTTDRRGRFALTIFPQISDAYYLSVESKDGALRANRVVKAEPAEIDVALQPVIDDTGSLRIGMAGRFQGLPVEVSINGAPQDPYVLLPEHQLEIEGLEAGIWRAEVWWNHDHVERGHQFTLKPAGRAELALVLPLGAIEGQTAEERRRAGR